MRLFLPLLIVVALTRGLIAQSVVDANLRVETYVRGLDNPTGVVFLNGAGDALITQKNDGKVLLIKNRKIVGTALDLPVANESERGLLSIALSPTFATDQRVYLYHTVAKADGGDAISNTVSRYRLQGSKLVFDRDVLSLPGTPGPNHDGGKIAFDPKGKLLAIIGDLQHKEQTQNFETSSTLSRTSSILRVERSGAKIPTNPFASAGKTHTVKDDIFAYGIRNSFGLTVDPVTGNIWDTENGPDRYDEINRVTAGFNSGWRDVTGPLSRNDVTPAFKSLGAKAAYSDPEFSWAMPVAPTDLNFYGGSHLGPTYKNDLFVGDVNTGSLYHFDLTADRKSLVLTGALADGVADNTTGGLGAEQADIRFGSGFGAVTDLIDGPGGLFALSLTNGRLYRIRTNDSVGAAGLAPHDVPEPASAAMLLVAAAATCARRVRRF